jgi:preprotein translocase subunit YajC
LSLIRLLADAATQPSGTVPPPFWANPQQLIIPLMLGVVLFIFLSSSRGRKQEQKTRDELLKNMKRGDRVMTIGGILGTVVDVRDSEVVLKVDESTNTKMKFTREAIKRVMGEEETPAAK